MKVVVIGANGKIGRIVTKMLQEKEEFAPTAFIRKEEQKPYFESIDVPVILASLENSVEEIAHKIKGFDTLVFTAGSGGKTGFDQTLAIDLDGAVKSMLAAEQVGIKRFIMVSASLADERSMWDNSGIKPYYIAKHFADRELQNSSLDYTILRPVRLTDETGTANVTIKEKPVGISTTIPREDVATSIIEVLNQPQTIGKIIVLSSGKTPIKEAILSM